MSAARFDPDDINARTDLLGLTGADTTLKRVAATGGGEYAGPCPFCGGEDRFRVQPERGLWWCRQCSEGGHWQDAIAYVMKRDGMDFPEACRFLGGGPAPTPARRPRRAATPPQAATEPTAAWREAAAGIVAEFEGLLWSERGEKARAWLLGRGLKDETLRTWRVGFNPEGREIGGLWVPRGITLPWSAGGLLWQVKVRRAEGQPKYLAVKGGHPLLYGADTLAGCHVAVLTEGEFDAMLLHQEAGDLVGVATLGGCGAAMGARQMRLLLPVGRLFVAYDRDKAGRDGAAMQTALSRRMREMRVPMGMDITEFWQAGGNLRDWVRLALAREGLGAGDMAPAPDRRADARHWSEDPRPDLHLDSPLWTRLLAAAHARDGHDPRGLAGALHRIRCEGAALVPVRGHLHLTPGAVPRDEFKAMITNHFAPHERALWELLLLVEREVQEQLLGEPSISDTSSAR